MITQKGRSAITASKEKNIHAGHRQRLKQRFRAAGTAGFEKHTLLELLLFFSVPRKDTNPIAHELLNRFDDLDGVFSASIDELMQVEGIGEETALFLNLVGEITRYSQNEKKKKQSKMPVLDTTAKAGAYLGNFFYGQKNESLLVICMDAKNQVTHCEKLNAGSKNRTTTTLGEIARLCARYNVREIMLAHNHPSGLVFPSREDIAMTHKMRDFLREIDVTVHDHIIVTDKEYYSMKDHKLM